MSFLRKPYEEEDDEPEQSFHSFIVEDKDLPLEKMKEQEVDEYQTVEEYYKNLSLQFYSLKPLELNIQKNVEKKQPKSVGQHDFHVQTHFTSANHMKQVSNFQKRRNVILKPRAQNHDTTSTANSIHNNTTSIEPKVRLLFRKLFLIKTQPSKISLLKKQENSNKKPLNQPILRKKKQELEQLMRQYSPYLRQPIFRPKKQNDSSKLIQGLYFHPPQ